MLKSSLVKVLANMHSFDMQKNNNWKKMSDNLDVIFTTTIYFMKTLKESETSQTNTL